MGEKEIKEQRRRKNKLSSVTNSSGIYKAFTFSPLGDGEVLSSFITGIWIVQSYMSCSTQACLPS